MILQLAHVCLKVSSLEKTIDFYHKKLGLPIKFTFEKEGKLYGVYFQVGNNTFIEAFQEKNPDFKNINNNTAAVVIGDRALKLRNSYPYNYDLALEWKNFTGLPFVFACWVTNTNEDENYLQLFNTALQFGLDHRHLLFDSLANDNYDTKKYLTENIHYVLSDEKRKGMENFL